MDKDSSVISVEGTIRVTKLTCKDRHNIFYSKSLIDFYFIYNIEKQSNTTYNVTYLQFVTNWYKENIYNCNNDIETNCSKVKLLEVCVIEEYYCD